MSISFSGKSGEMEGDSWNLMPPSSKSNYGWRSQSSVCWIGAAAVCAGLLLLTMIMVASNTSAINQWDKKYENLIYEITKGRDELRDERDQLKIHSGNLTREMELLQRQYNTVAASRDKLQQEFDKLNLNATYKPCQPEWVQFNNKCYFFSPNGVTKTWENSRKFCKQKGVDLAIINTKAEHDFVKKSCGVTWIGLFHDDTDDKWKWVDGTEQVGRGFWQVDEPNNVDGEEDCAEVSGLGWNDVPCSRKFSFVCEE